MNFIKKAYLFFVVVCCIPAGLSSALSKEARDKGFVYLHEVDPTIIASVRYYTNENFLGRRIKGYKKAVVIMTQQAAQALKRVQTAVKKDGYSLVVYDAYRPQEAVNNFMVWADDIADQVKKSEYYPRINKADVFELQYVSKRSGHSRGSTVDLTLIKLDSQPHAIQKKSRQLLDGFTVLFLDDGTVDMGSSFDLFDVASHFENNLVEQKFKTRRTYLKSIMEQHGFKNMPEEWWHFTLKNEPYPAQLDDSYFNFPIE